MAKRGGRRPGAGAPQGNKNRLVHGRYSSDPKLRAVWGSLTESQREVLLPLLRKAGAEFETAAEEALREGEPEGSSKVIPIQSKGDPSSRRALYYTHTHTHNQNQSNGEVPEGKREELIQRLVVLGFMGADRFVDHHLDAWADVEHVLEELQIQEDDGARFRNRGALIRQLVHERTREYVGRLVQCWACKKVLDYDVTAPTRRESEGGSA